MQQCSTEVIKHQKIKAELRNYGKAGKRLKGLNLTLQERKQQTVGIISQQLKAWQKRTSSSIGIGQLSLTVR